MRLGRMMQVGLRLILLLGTCELLAAACLAQQPTYLILRSPPAPARHPHHHAPPPPPSAYGIVEETRPYAYGWFGAQPKPQWSRHFGYYRNYTEWSAR